MERGTGECEIVIVDVSLRGWLGRLQLRVSLRRRTACYSPSPLPSLSQKINASAKVRLIRKKGAIFKEITGGSHWVQRRQRLLLSGSGILKHSPY